MREHESKVGATSRRRSAAVRHLSTLVAGAALFAGCSTNPATGKKQLSFYGEAEEIAIGREADAQIVAELGLVDDAELQAWVGGMGRKLAPSSERPDLPWSFKVVDDPVVNAFALPGGFIYVTRGLLGHLRNEAQLAAVLGHEIGHVTARHGVNQMSKAQLAQGGLILGTILAPQGAAQSVAQLGQTGLGLIFLKYGRDDERQADDLGLRYLSRGGFDPFEMPGVFEVLRKVGELAGGGRIPNWMSSHPDPGARRERAREKIVKGSYGRGVVGSEPYLRETDGLAFGADPRAGYFEGRTFYHPALEFSLRVPDGWAAANEASRVVAAPSDGSAQAELTLSAETRADEAAKKFLAQEGLEDTASRSVRRNGLAAVRAEFRVPRESQDAIVGRAAFVEHGGRVFRLLGLYLEGKSSASARPVDAFVDSFERLTDRSRLDVKPQRLEVVELPRAMSFREFARAYPSEARPELLELINGVDDPEARLAAGTRLRRITGRATGSQRLEAAK